MNMKLEIISDPHVRETSVCKFCGETHSVKYMVELNNYEKVPCCNMCALKQIAEIE